MTKIAPYGTTERREQDREMILLPERWPMGRLFLKNPSRYNSGRANLATIGPGGVGSPDGSQPFEIRHSFTGRVSSEEYTDVDALLDDGWTVD